MLTSKLNQTRAYQKFTAQAVRLEVMPDHSNDLIRKKKEEYGPFNYNRPELEATDAQTLGPLEF